MAKALNLKPMKAKRMTCISEILKPRIYVACLAAYNNGILHGAWIDADQSGEEIRREIAAMLATSPVPDGEEYAIHDYDGFGDVRIEEYTGIDAVAAIAAFLDEHGELGAMTLAHTSGNIDEARIMVEDRYLGCFESLADYVQEMTEDTLDIPEPLRFYIDWQAMARDAEINGDLTVIEASYNEVHLFAAC